MRRQAGFSEGLGWPISARSIQRLAAQGRAATPRSDQAETAVGHLLRNQRSAGAAKVSGDDSRFAFWTRSFLVYRVRNLLVVIAVAVLVLLLMTLSLVLGMSVATGLAHAAGPLAPTVVLVLIAVDLLGWILRINRQAAAIREVENGLNRLVSDTQVGPSDVQVVRLVTEYDCALATAVPIHQRIFARKHDEIARLWDERLRSGQSVD